MLFSASQTCEKANGEKIRKRTRLILNTMKTSMRRLQVTNLGLPLSSFGLPEQTLQTQKADPGFGWGLFSVRLGLVSTVHSVP